MADFIIRIDKDKCTDCGLCARDCVSGVIQDKGDGPSAENPSWCNLCSHCVAVCPAGAVSHSGLAGTEPRPVKMDEGAAAAYREVVMGRRSVRHFKDQEVTRDEIEEILDLASYSPTASNTMDVGYVVITDRELIRETGAKLFKQAAALMRLLEKPWGKAILWLYVTITGQKALLRYIERLPLYMEWTESGRDMITHNAPALIIIHAPKKGRFNDGNCHIAAANITNHAHANGLGSCYLGLLVTPMNQSKKLSASLGVPEGRRAYVALAMGRPAYKYANSPVRKKPDVKWM